MPHKWVVWQHNPCCLGGPQHFKEGESGAPEVGTLAVLGVPNTSKQGRSAPQVGGMATQPLLSWGSPTLQRGGE